MSHWSRKLQAIGACLDAVEWARTQPSLAAAWRTCERGDWMLWLAGRRIDKLGSMAHRRVVQAAAACARLALPIYEARRPGDRRARAAIVAAERWARVPIAVNQKAAYAAASAAFAARKRSLSRSAAIVRRIVPCPRLPRKDI